MSNRDGEYTFDLLLENLAPLKIGSGEKSADFDQSVLKTWIDGIETPYIPGTSLKGVLRNAVEQELRRIGETCCDSAVTGKSCGRRYQDQIISAQKVGSKDQLKKIVGEFCTVCKLFGSHGYRGSVRLEDALPQPSRGGLFIETSERKGIAIDRVAGSVAQSALFSTEYVEVGSKFLSKLRVRDTDERTLALLLSRILEFNTNRLKLGGLTTKGYGLMKIEITNAEWKELSLEKSVDMELPWTKAMDGENNSLTQAIGRWAKSAWDYPSTGKSLKEVDREQGRERYEPRGGRLIVKKINMTPRNESHLSNSGGIRFALMPFKGYSVFVGAGHPGLSTKKTDSRVMEMIEAGASFSEIVEKGIVTDDKTSQFEAFCYQKQHGRAKGNPVIPGATLKGLFRSRMEHSFVEVEGSVFSCFVKQDRYSSNPSSVHKKLYGDQGRIQERESCTDFRHPCIICDIFGMTTREGSLKGLVEILDAPLRRGRPRPVEVPVGNGRTSRLLAVTYADNDEKPPAFIGSLRFRNLSDTKLGLLLMSMAANEKQGIRIGRFHYRDAALDPIEFGRMTIKIFGIDFDDGRSIKDNIMQYVEEMKKKALDTFGEGIRSLSDCEEGIL